MSVYALAWALKLITILFAVLGNLFPKDGTTKSIVGRTICFIAAAACIGALIAI